MAKTLRGTIVRSLMQTAAVVEVTRYVPHPKYHKLQKRSKKFKAALNGNTVAAGDTVEITETKPVSKDVHFAITKVVTGSEKKKGGKK